LDVREPYHSAENTQFSNKDKINIIFGGFRKQLYRDFEMSQECVWALITELWRAPEDDVGS
jgi:hypothetical protein